MRYFLDKYDSKKYVEEKLTHIEVSGGDGTLLKAIHQFKDFKKPFFGIASGTVNFLMNKQSVILDNHIKKTFSLIKIETFTDQGEIEIHHGFNDVVIGSFNGWIQFNCTDKDNLLESFNGSGLIISTAQGSTGINKNNHGTILPLSSNHWSVTGMQCNRNINYVLEPNELIIECNSRFPVEVNIDGKNIVIESVVKVTITKGSTIELIFNNYQEFKEKRRI